MGVRFKEFLIILALTLVPTLFVWLPFFLRIGNFWGIPLPQNGMATIVANYDGPLFLVVAKTFYNRELIKGSFQFPLPTEYYASHFPLFPILIRLFSFILGYPYSMLAVTVTSSFLAIFFFNKLAKLYVAPKDTLWLTLVFSLFPARWLVVRSVGSAEPLFLASIIASLYYFQNKKYLLAGAFGAAAQLTKSPGILLFVSYMLMLVWPRIKNLNISLITPKKFLALFIIPLSLLAVFFLYKFTYNDFWAYFHSGDNIHLSFPPFQIFNYSAPWVGTFWIEEVIFVYLFGILGLLQLIKQGKRELAWFVGVFFISTLFVAHRDITRYSLPIVPFILVAFSDFLVKKEFKIAMALIAFPIYLFSLAYISQNVMPISNWAPFL